MTQESAKAQQAIVFNMDDECYDLPIDEYLKVLQSLKIVIQERINMIQFEVDKKIKDITS